jgi:hypothetical protein
MPGALLLLLAAAAAPPALVPASPWRCLDLRDPRREVALEGRLTLETFPGPPNYESVRRGDAPERHYILALRRDICIEDGGDFADPEERFRHVQLFSTRRRVAARLAGARGQRVRVRGQGIAANNARHHAPLVVDVREIRAEGR